MRFEIHGRLIDVFSTEPRIEDATLHWSALERVIEGSERERLTGLLIFTGNDTHLDPWITAQALLQRTIELSPLVAINPVYMHPFTAARMVASLSWLYGRKVHLNMVTGTALSHLEALNDRVEHADRYARLVEYVTVMSALLIGGGLTTFQGRFVSVSSLRLPVSLPAELMPDILLAGQSEPARRAAAAVGGVWMQMLPPTLDDGLDGARAVHFGVVARPTEEEAWMAARTRFVETPEGSDMLDLSMTNTDSTWKRRLKTVADADAIAAPGYWLTPFRNFQADCPYLVGSHARVGDVIRRLVARGVDRLVLEIPPDADEFTHVGAALRWACRGARSALSAWPADSRGDARRG